MAAVCADWCNCRASTNVLEHFHVALGMTCIQVVTGALSAFGCKLTFGRAPFKLVRIC